jgi:hypothetical protein
VLVALPVVADRGLGDRGLQGGQVEHVAPGRRAAPGAGLQRGQRLARVAAGDADQVLLGLVGRA